MGHPSPTNETPTTNCPTTLQPLTLGQFERCPGNGVLWLCLLESRRQRKALAGGTLYHKDSNNQCLTAYPTHPAGLHNHPELRHHIPKDELARKTASPSAKRTLVLCWVELWSCGIASIVELWGCGSASRFLWINFKDLISGYDCMYINIQYQATCNTALQKSWATESLCLCAAERVAAAAAAAATSV